MRALVTGADGFVGRWLVQHLEASGDEVWQACGMQHGHHGPRSRSVDLRDPKASLEVVAAARPDAIFHLAAVAFGPDAQQSPADALEITVGGTMNVMRAAAGLESQPTVLISSSGEVYGRPSSDAMLSEQDPVAPVSAYGASKAAQEMVAMAYHHAGVVQVVVARAFNHIGPGQRESFVVSSFAHQLAAIAAGEQEPILRVGNLHAERDFTDVRDVVAAYRLLVDRRLTGEPYNVASGRATSVNGILRDLIAVSGLEVEVEVDAGRMRAADPPIVVGDARRLREATGWAPAVPYQMTLRHVWDDALVRSGVTNS